VKQWRHAAYIGLRFVLLAIALVAVSMQARRTFSPLTRDDAIALAICWILFVLLLRINVPLLSIAYYRRRHLEPGRLTLELPIVLLVFAVYGPAAVAVMELTGYPFAIPPEGRSRLLWRVLDGGAEAFFWICIGVIQPYLIARIPPLSLPAYGAYVSVYTAAIFVFLLFVWVPLRAYVKSILIARLWLRVLRDTRLFAYVIAMVSWGYVCVMIWQRAGMTLGLVAFAPLPFLAIALRALHEHQLELHRLRLARDAVQAMLRARDPIPQMNSLLASLHAPAAEETLQIYAALKARDRLAPLAAIGPIPSAEQFDAVRLAIAELQHDDRAFSLQRSREFTVCAYAVRSPDDILLGALVVHRPNGTASLFAQRRFAHAAAEMMPLLRDFRAIAATQNAASVDALTGLANRRAIMDLLRQRIEHATLGGGCALLLLDVDHFKAINDSLGHQAGDHCLRTVGAVIARNIRSDDRAGRIGGEEFVIMMPDTASEMARTVGERLRSAIENAEIRHADGQPVTVSIGVAVGDAGETVDSLLARADRALYQAKRQGRNRVIEISA
jgi:diguanylate cyclase (GGDEF)-like protein